MKSLMQRLALRASIAIGLAGVAGSSGGCVQEMRDSKGKTSAVYTGENSGLFSDEEYKQGRVKEKIEVALWNENNADIVYRGKDGKFIKKYGIKISGKKVIVKQYDFWGRIVKKNEEEIVYETQEVWTPNPNAPDEYWETGKPDPRTGLQVRIAKPGIEWIKSGEQKSKDYHIKSVPKDFPIWIYDGKLALE